MKNILLSFTLIISLLFAWSCKKEETLRFVVPSKGIVVAVPGGSGSTSFEEYNISSVVPTSVPKGWSVTNIDMYSNTITVTAPATFDDGEQESGTLTLQGVTPIGTTVSLSINVALITEEVDYSDASANCYVASKPLTRYIFDPMVGGCATPLETAYVKLLWQSSENLVKYLDMCDGKVVFYLDATDKDKSLLKPGNALVGAYNSSNELIWSWHLWMTNNDPTASENTITLGGMEVMNINLGAECNSNGSTDGQTIFDSFGTYYQWGRKEPFLGPKDYTFPSNSDNAMYNYNGKYIYYEYVASNATNGNVAWAVRNPLALIKGNKDNGYDWLNEGHDDNLWSTTSKTESDPCPAGWRVADASVFEGLAIATANDEMDWKEAQARYGLMLVDGATSAEYFFTAQGRRNYLDCRLDIINDNPSLPVPWAGYYWTATVDGDDASALWFDLTTPTRANNVIDTKRAMHRSNALPVRCVRL